VKIQRQAFTTAVCALLLAAALTPSSAMGTPAPDVPPAAVSAAPSDPAGAQAPASGGVLTAGLEGLTNPSPELLAARDRVVELSAATQVAADSYATAVATRDAALARAATATQVATDATATASAARAALGDYAASAYMSGGLPASVAAALEAPTPTEMVSRQNTLTAVSDTSADLVRVLRKAEATAESARGRAERASRTARGAAEDARASAEAAQSASDEATVLLSTLVSANQVAAAAVQAETDAAGARERLVAYTQAGGASAGAAAVLVALDQVGKSYVWGASGAETFDCSGLTQWAWASAGVAIPRVSRDQFAGLAKVSREELLPGDLVFFGSPVHHVGLYIGDGQMVHAPKPGDVVRIAPAFWVDYVGAARPGA
jgi:peptidoglycan DL-endopeptidase CwlO